MRMRINAHCPCSCFGVLHVDGPLAGVASFSLDLINVIPYDFDKALTTDRTSMSISGAQLGLSRGVV